MVQLINCVEKSQYSVFFLKTAIQAKNLHSFARKSASPKHGCGADLVAHKVGVVRAVDEVVGQGLGHVLQFNIKYKIISKTTMDCKTPRSICSSDNCFLSYERHCSLNTDSMIYFPLCCSFSHSASTTVFNIYLFFEKDPCLLVKQSFKYICYLILTLLPVGLVEE